VIHEAGFDDTFYYFGNERQIRDWPIVREFFFVQCCTIIMLIVSVDKILIFAVVKQWLLQQRATEASFVAVI